MINNITIPPSSTFDNQEAKTALAVVKDEVMPFIDNQHKLYEDKNETTTATRNITKSEDVEEKTLYIEKLIDIFAEIGVTEGKHKELAKQFADAVFRNKRRGLYKFKDRIGRNQENKVNMFICYRMNDNNTPKMSSWGLSSSKSFISSTHGFVLEDCTGRPKPKIKFL